MRFLLASIGSNGDIHPYVGIGIALRQRGHDVALIAQPYFERLIREAGLEYIPAGERFDLAQIAQRPEMMGSRFGTARILRDLIIPEAMNLERAAAGAVRASRPDAVLFHHLCFGIGWAAQRAGVPAAIGCLSPLAFASRFDRAVFMPGGPESRPGWRASFNLNLAKWGCRFLYDRPLNRIRRELGYEPVSDQFIREIRHSDLTLALWSARFRPPMEDDPAAARICGFPWYDRHREQEHASEPIERFLDSGPPPIIFTLGSTAVHVAGPFYQASAGACRILNRRGLLLTGRPEYAPRNLPPGVAAFTYAPYSVVLPRGCATVHHGGIGTTAQSMRAGTPTVIVPFAHDQFDNAARTRRLGLSATVSRSRVTPESLAAALRQLLDDPDCLRRAADFGRSLSAEDGAESAADELERLAQTGRKNQQIKN